MAGTSRPTVEAATTVTESETETETGTASGPGIATGGTPETTGTIVADATDQGLATDTTGTDHGRAIGTTAGVTTGAGEAETGMPGIGDGDQRTTDDVGETRMGVTKNGRLGDETMTIVSTFPAVSVPNIIWIYNIYIYIAFRKLKGDET